MRNVLIYILLPTVFWSGCAGSDCKSGDGLPITPDSVVQANATICDVHRAAQVLPTQVTADIIISGTVTSSDQYGNFYKCLFIEDSTDSIVLKVGLYDIYRMYHLGQYVSIRLRGLSLWIEDQLLYLGFDNGASIDNLTLLSQHVLRQPPCEVTFIPQVVAISNLNDSLLGRMIIIHDLRFQINHLSSNYEGLQTMVDPLGQTLKLYTSPYADFAGEPLPEESFSITGILTKPKNKYQLTISSAITL